MVLKENLLFTLGGCGGLEGELKMKQRAHKWKKSNMSLSYVLFRMIHVTLLDRCHSHPRWECRLDHCEVC